MTNDPVAGHVRLAVKSRVEIELAITPARIVFPEFIGRNGSNKPLYAGLTGTKSTSANIVSIESKNPLINVEFNREGFGDDPRRHIRISILPGMKIGRFREQVIFKTDSKNTPTLKLYVLGEAIGNITVTPRNLSLGMIDPDKNTPKRLVLRSVDDAFTFNVLDVSSTIQGIATELVTVIPGKEYQIIVSMPNGAPQPVIRGNISIKTDTVDQETITVRAFGYTPKAPGVSRSKRVTPRKKSNNLDKEPPL